MRGICALCLLALLSATSGCATIESIARGGNPQAGSIVFFPDYTYCGTRSLIEEHPGVCPAVYQATAEAMIEAPLSLPITAPLAFAQIASSLITDTAFLPVAIAPQVILGITGYLARKRREEEEP